MRFSSIAVLLFGVSLAAQTGVAPAPAGDVQVIPVTGEGAAYWPRPA
jgi:hypothetical protein